MDQDLDQGLHRLLREAEDVEELVVIVRTIEQPVDLHAYAEDYNWDDGFDVPRAIADHPACDKATALKLLWLADPMPYWSGEIERSQYLAAWYDFCELMTTRLTTEHYPPAKLRFDPGLTKVQQYKLKKQGVQSCLFHAVG